MLMQGIPEVAPAASAEGDCHPSCNKTGDPDGTVGLPLGDGLRDIAAQLDSQVHSLSRAHSLGDELQDITAQLDSQVHSLSRTSMTEERKSATDESQCHPRPNKKHPSPSPRPPPSCRIAKNQIVRTSSVAEESGPAWSKFTNCDFVDYAAGVDVEGMDCRTEQELVAVKQRVEEMGYAGFAVVKGMASLKLVGKQLTSSDLKPTEHNNSFWIYNLNLRAAEAEDSGCPPDVFELENEPVQHELF